MTTKTEANLTTGEAQARLAELEERIAAGGPVTQDEFAAAEAAVRFAERVDEARGARDTAAAETARLAAVEDARRGFVAGAAGLAAELLAAADAMRAGLDHLWTVAERYNKLVGATAAEVASLAKAGPTPGIEVGSNPFGHRAVTVGGVSHPKRMIGGVQVSVDRGLARRLMDGVLSDAERARGEHDGPGFSLDERPALAARRAPLDHPTRRWLERVAAMTG